MQVAQNNAHKTLYNSPNNVYVSQETYTTKLIFVSADAAVNDMGVRCSEFVVRTFAKADKKQDKPKAVRY